jgi:hypothetical protein
MDTCLSGAISLSDERNTQHKLVLEEFAFIIPWLRLKCDTSPNKLKDMMRGLIILQLPRLTMVFLHSRWIFKIIYQGAYISIEGNEESFIFLQVDQLDSETMQ